MPDDDAEPVAADLPPMPRPSPRSFGDLPLQAGSTSTLGIKVKSPDHAFYFLAARGALRRYGRRFPLTEEGWADAWTAFAREDPTGAALYRDSLATGSPRPAAVTRTAASRVDDYADGWMFVLLGGVGWMAAAALVYEGLRHGSTMPVLVGAALAFLQHRRHLLRRGDGGDPTRAPSLVLAQASRRHGTTSTSTLPTARASTAACASAVCSKG